MSKLKDYLIKEYNVNKETYDFIDEFSDIVNNDAKIIALATKARDVAKSIKFPYENPDGTSTRHGGRLEVNNIAEFYAGTVNRAVRWRSRWFEGDYEMKEVISELWKDTHLNINSNY